MNIIERIFFIWVTFPDLECMMWDIDVWMDIYFFT